MKAINPTDARLLDFLHNNYSIWDLKFIQESISSSHYKQHISNDTLSSEECTQKLFLQQNKIDVTKVLVITSI